MKLSKSVAFITFSILTLSTATFVVSEFFYEISINKMLDAKYQIDTIIQRGLVREALPTIFFAEILGLSYDKVTNFFTFDERVAEKKILSNNVIKYVNVKKIKPNIIYIDYEVRQPIAVIADFSNRAIDDEAFIFQLAPYFPVMKLPSIYLGINKIDEDLVNERVNLAFHIMKIIEYALLPHDITLEYIDLSRVSHPSYGKREIVVIFEVSCRKHYLRLNVKNYSKDLGNYLSIKDKINDQEWKRVDKVIDMRINKLAYIEELVLEGG